MYSPNNSFKIHEAKMIELKGEIDKPTITAGDQCSSVTDRTNRQVS